MIDYVAFGAIVTLIVPLYVQMFRIKSEIGRVRTDVSYLRGYQVARNGLDDSTYKRSG